MSKPIVDIAKLAGPGRAAQEQRQRALHPAVPGIVVRRPARVRPGADSCRARRQTLAALGKDHHPRSAPRRTPADITASYLPANIALFTGAQIVPTPPSTSWRSLLASISGTAPPSAPRRGRQPSPPPRPANRARRHGQANEAKSQTPRLAADDNVPPITRRCGASARAAARLAAFAAVAAALAAASPARGGHAQGFERRPAGASGAERGGNETCCAPSASVAKRGVRADGSLDSRRRGLRSRSPSGRLLRWPTRRAGGVKARRCEPRSCGNPARLVADSARRHVPGAKIVGVAYARWRRASRRRSASSNDGASARRWRLGARRHPHRNPQT